MANAFIKLLIAAISVFSAPAKAASVVIFDPQPSSTQGSKINSQVRTEIDDFYYAITPVLI